MTDLNIFIDINNLIYREKNNHVLEIDIQMNDNNNNNKEKSQITTQIEINTK